MPRFYMHMTFTFYNIHKEINGQYNENMSCKCTILWQICHINKCAGRSGDMTVDPAMCTCHELRLQFTVTG